MTVQISKFRRQERHLHRRIGIARRSGDVQALDVAIQNYLNSYAAKIVAAEKAKRECKRRTHKSVDQIARDLDLWSPCEETVYATIGSETRSDGTPRILLDFGVENQARQLLIKRAIYWPEALAHEQTLTQGGATAAVHQIHQAYESGYRWVSEMDIRRCYQSFDRRRAGRYLRLPEGVIENSLTLNTSCVQPSNTCRRQQLSQCENDPQSLRDQFINLWGEHLEIAQRGLIEGSKLSPFIVEMLLAPVCQNLQEEDYGCVINYADNFLIMASSTVDRDGLEELLREEALLHPAGELMVRDCHKVPERGEVFEFLGYRFYPVDGCLLVSMGEKTEKKLREIRRIAYQKLNSHRRAAKFKREVMADVEKEHRSTLRGLPCIFFAEEYMAEKLTPMRDIVRRAERA